MGALQRTALRQAPAGKAEATATRVLHAIHIRFGTSYARHVRATMCTDDEVAEMCSNRGAERDTRNATA